MKAKYELPRKVVVRSPVNGQTNPVPPSVQEEKTRRRGIKQLKPIIKPGSNASKEPSIASAEEGESAGGVIPDYSFFIRGPYNRPVAGAIPYNDRGGINQEAAKATPSEPDHTGEDKRFDESWGPKRKSLVTDNQNLVRQRSPREKQKYLTKKEPLRGYIYRPSKALASNPIHFFSRNRIIYHNKVPSQGKQSR